MGAIHLIERDNRYTRLGQGPEWESGYWAVSEVEAQGLIGCQIYFHEKQIEPSYYGGVITGFRAQPEGEFAGRIIFRFIPKQECRGVLAGATGWQFEKKIVR
jgi:hypothetical protein